jgi:hypothetical protein
MTIVDGKQRITTPILFFENKIGFKYKGRVIFAKDVNYPRLIRRIESGHENA